MDCGEWSEAASEKGAYGDIFERSLKFLYVACYDYDIGAPLGEKLAQTSSHAR